MSSILIAVLGIVLLLALLACGMNIGITMIFVGMLGISVLASPKAAVSSLASIPFTQGTTYTYAVIPLFVLMGQLAYVSGISSGLFDFANKWAESVGQAEYYALKTGKRGMVVLILEDSKKDFVYLYRVKKLAEIHNFDVEFITPEILNLKDGKCPYPDCKCNKK